MWRGPFENFNSLRVIIQNLKWHLVNAWGAHRSLENYEMYSKNPMYFHAKCNNIHTVKLSSQFLKICLANLKMEFREKRV